MKTLVNNLFNLIEESNGFWMTDNNTIEGDEHDMMLSKDDKAIYLMYENENLKFNFTDIIGICYEIIQNTVVAILKLINRPSILIHIL